MIRLIWLIISISFSTFTVRVQAAAPTESVCKTSKQFLSARVSSDDDGQGGPDPLYFDTWAGVWVDPVSGLIVDEGIDFGHVRDPETGAKFYIPRGLWVDPKTLAPVRSERLNTFPYYDPQTHQTIDPRTGERSPYLDVLLTIGGSRIAADRVRYACLGDDLHMRIDPATGRYLAALDGAPVDDTLFDTLNAMIDGRPTPRLVGDRYVPPSFVDYMQYDTGMLRDGLDLTNGISRDEAVKIVHQKFAPESSESGSYELREARIEDGVVTQITARGLMDDAVSAVQILLFFDTSMNGRDRLLNVGVRQKCGRSNSSDAWTRERC